MTLSVVSISNISFMSLWQLITQCLLGAQSRFNDSIPTHRHSEPRGLLILLIIKYLSFHIVRLQCLLGVQYTVLVLYI